MAEQPYHLLVEPLELRIIVYRHFVEAGSAPSRHALAQIVGDLLQLRVRLALAHDQTHQVGEPRQQGRHRLEQMALPLLAGQLRHAREMSSVFAQWVNSYKRLVPDFEAPVYVAWSRRNRSALIRVPGGQTTAGTGHGLGEHGIELRCPDAACNPYLTFAAMLQAGLEGIEQGYELPEPMDRNLYHLGANERRRLGIEPLPESLGDAIELTADSELMLRTFGERMLDRFVELKRREWHEYRVQVTNWEQARYLPVL